MSGNLKPLRLSIGGRGASRGAGGGGRAPLGAKGIIVLIFLVALLVAIALVLLRHPWGQSGERGVATSGPSSTTAAAVATDPISERRIIFGGMPRAMRSDVHFTVLRNRAYVVGYSDERRDPLWTAYRVIKVEGEVREDRPRGNFLTDDRTRARVTHQDFTNSGYDRGHMAPNFAIATRFGSEAQLETFLLTNICPQAPALNEKVWERLERMEVTYSNKLGEVWVMDGPVFGDMSGGTTSKLKSGVTVPSAFYKIVVEEQEGKPRVFSVIMPQSVKGTESPGQFLTSVAEIEKKTGLEFLWTLDAGAQAALKGKVWPMW